MQRVRAGRGDRGGGGQKPAGKARRRPPDIESTGEPPLYDDSVSGIVFRRARQAATSVDHGLVGTIILSEPFAGSIQRVVELEQSTSLSIQNSSPIRARRLRRESGSGIDLDPMGLEWMRTLKLSSRTTGIAYRMILFDDLDMILPGFPGPSPAMLEKMYGTCFDR